MVIWYGEMIGIAAEIKKRFGLQGMNKNACDSKKYEDFSQKCRCRNNFPLKRIVSVDLKA